MLEPQPLVVKVYHFTRFLQCSVELGCQFHTSEMLLGFLWVGCAFVFFLMLIALRDYFRNNEYLGLTLAVEALTLKFLKKCFSYNPRLCS